MGISKNHIKWDITLLFIIFCFKDCKINEELYFEDKGLSFEESKLIIQLQLASLIDEQKLIEQFYFLAKYYSNTTIMSRFNRFFSDIILPFYNERGFVEKMNISQFRNSEYNFTIHKQLPVSSGQVSIKLIENYNFWKGKQELKEKINQIKFLLSFDKIYFSAMAKMHCELCGSKKQVLKGFGDICLDCFFSSGKCESIDVDLNMYVGAESIYPIDANGDNIRYFTLYINENRELIFVNYNEIYNIKGILIVKSDEILNYDFSKLYPYFSGIKNYIQKTIIKKIHRKKYIQISIF